ncbi:MAG: hypothetical protein FD167_4665, partial [bacterium]
MVNNLLTPEKESEILAVEIAGIKFKNPILTA